MLDARIGGGTAERTFQMSRHLARAGNECTVLALDTGLPPERLEAIRPARVVLLSIAWRRFQVPWPRISLIRRLVAEADVIHLMGHWSVLNALVYWFAYRSGKPYVVCPAGALPIFGRSAVLKRIYNSIVGDAIIRNAAGWIAVTASEYPAFGVHGIVPERVRVIPNGVDAADFVLEPAARDDASPLDAAPYILFMGRLNPIKGPDLLLAAYARLAAVAPDLQLVFAGPDEGMRVVLERRAAELGLASGVHFPGRVDGQQKARLYRGAALLVVPSRQEAMSVVALEAGICGVPVLLTDQCGFPEIRGVDSRLEVPATADGLAAGLSALCVDMAVLPQIGLRMKEFVQARYAWSSIVTQYLALYKSIRQKAVPV